MMTTAITMLIHVYIHACIHTSVIITILARHISYIAIIIGAITFSLSREYSTQKKAKRLHVFIKVLVKLGGKGGNSQGTQPQIYHTQ